MNAPEFWHQRSWLGYVLWPVSMLYWVIACLRLSRYNPEPLPVPVICIGNTTVGGSGKTPLVIACVQMLKAAGKNPHVISRGYKGRYEGIVQVDPAQHSAADVGDEPLLIARHAPCWVARRRVDAALAAITAGADCIVMDDGLQNPTLKKHLSILVVDGAYGFGNRQMLPAGPCREPIGVSLHKAQIMLVMGEATHPDVVSLAKAHPAVFYATLQPKDAAAVAGKRWLAFAGIGRPEKFFDTLKAHGAQLAGKYAFADHHAFTSADLERLQQEADAAQAALITTEKDWLRLSESWRKKVAVFPVEAMIAQEDAFAALLLQAANGET